MSREQALSALANANRIRMRMVRIREEIEDGKLTIENALNDPDAGSMTVYRLVKAKPHWGKTKVSRLLKYLSIGHLRLVRDLTPSQRREIVEYLNDRH